MTKIKITVTRVNAKGEPDVYGSYVKAQVDNSPSGGLDFMLHVVHAEELGIGLLKNS